MKLYFSVWLPVIHFQFLATFYFFSLVYGIWQSTAQQLLWKLGNLPLQYLVIHESKCKAKFQKYQLVTKIMTKVSQNDIGITKRYRHLDPSFLSLLFPGLRFTLQDFCFFTNTSRSTVSNALCKSMKVLNCYIPTKLTSIDWLSRFLTSSASPAKICCIKGGYRQKCQT